MALSPDDRWLAVGGWMKESSTTPGHHVRLYDFQTGELKALLKGHMDVINALGFSGDSRRLISGSFDRTAIVWDVATGRQLHQLPGHKAELYAVGLTQNGDRAVTGGDDKIVRLWNANDGRLIRELPGHPQGVRALAFLGSDQFATGDWAGEIRFWNTTTGDLVRTFAQQGTAVGALSFSADGRTLLSTCGQSCSGRFWSYVWDVASGVRKIEYKNHDNIVIAAAVSPDGRWAATGGGEKREIHVWELATGERAKSVDGGPVRLAGTGGASWAVGFSPDGRRIGWGNTWRGSQGRVTHPSEATSPIEYQLTLPGAGQGLGRPQRVAAGAGEFLRSRKTHGTWRLNHRQGGNYGYEDAVLVIARDSGAPVEITRGATDGYQHRAYTFTTDADAVISCASNGTLMAYSLDGKVLAHFIGHEGDVWSVATSPNGKLLVSGSADQTVRLWPLAPLKDRDVGPAKQILPIVTLFHGVDGEWVMWTPEGYFDASPGGGEALIGWNINRGAGAAADFVRAEQLRKQLYRPDIVKRAIELASSQAAIREAGLSNVRLADLLSISLPEIRLTRQSYPVFAAGHGTVTVAVKGADAADLTWEVVVDGVTVTPREADPPADHPPVADSEELVALEIPLKKGINTIKITARNTVGSSNWQQLRLQHAGDGRLDVHGILRILAIGVDKYPGAKPSLADLRFAGRDAQEFAKVAAREMRPLHTGEPAIEVMFNGAGGEREPTRANILKALTRLRDSAGEADTVALLLAGHGEGGEGGSFFFLPTDAKLTGAGAIGDNAINWNEILDALPKAGRRLLFVDACRSGNAYSARVINDSKAAGFVVFSSADRNQRAYENEELRHGFFTYWLIEGLKGGAAATTDRAVTVYRLAPYLKDQVRDYSLKQRTATVQEPVYWPGPGDMLLARRW
jgi:WD40 repeat protein